MRVSVFCSKKEISIEPHVWSIKMIKLGNYFFLKIDYSANFVRRNSSWRKNKVKQKCLRKYGITSLLHQHYVHGVTYTYGTSFRILPFYERLERQEATSGLMHRICGLWLGSKLGVWPAVSPFVVFTKKYLQLYHWSSTTFTVAAKWTNRIENTDGLVSDFTVCLCSDLTSSHKECFLK